MEIYFQNVWRMDWGLGNPNKTAALIATLMVAVWGLAYIRRWGFWAALVLFTGLGVCLIHTFSRGGLVSLMAGLAVVLWKLSRPWPKRRLIAAMVAVWVMVGASLYLEAGGRYGQGIVQEDKSVTNRLAIWKTAPRMMVDAPWGWGIGKAGHTYMQWYQPLDRNEDYRTLVNSHLTWLVEFGWPLRFLYIFGWLAVVALSWPAKGRPWMGIPLGTWVAFGVAATFSSVAESLWLWVAPGAGLMGVIFIRLMKRQWPGKRAWLAAGTGSLAIMALIVAAALFRSNPTPIAGGAWRTVAGRGEPATWVVANSEVFGNHYGKAVRKEMENGGAMGAMGIAVRVEDLPNVDGKTVILAGELPQESLKKLKRVAAQAAKIILINPGFFPQETGIAATEAGKILVFQGEFSRSVAAPAWGDFTRRPMVQIEGAGDFLPEWTRVLTEKGQTRPVETTSIKPQ